MRHPTDGTLRRLVDEPAGVADADRRHVAGCPVCLSGLVAAREDAALAGAALSGAAFSGSALSGSALSGSALSVGAARDADPAVDVDAGWSRLSRAVAAGQPRRAPAAGPVFRWRVLRSPVVAVAAAVALLAGAGAAAAADWLQIFRTEQIAPLTLNQGDLVGMPDLSAYGDVELPEEVDVRRVADAAAAQKATGLTFPRVGALPRGVTGAPAYQVADRVTAVFTFSAAKAARTAAAAGEPLPPPPAGLDGSEFRLAAGPGTAAVWAESRGVPAMVVARVVAPTAYSSGVPFAAAADYLLSLPGMPEAVAKNLRGFTTDGTTLPLPVNSAYLTSAPGDVGGRPATVLTSRDGVIAGVVWVDDGVVTAVAGSLSADEVLSVARNLEW